MSFCLAVAGAVLYFTESSGYTSWFNMAFGIEHKYSKLLLISFIVMVGGCVAFLIGAALRLRGQSPAEATV